MIIDNEILRMKKTFLEEKYRLKLSILKMQSKYWVEKLNEIDPNLLNDC